MTGVFLKYLWEKCSKSEPNVIVKNACYLFITMMTH